MLRAFQGVSQVNQGCPTPLEPPCISHSARFDRQTGSGRSKNMWTSRLWPVWRPLVGPTGRFFSTLCGLLTTTVCFCQRSWMGLDPVLSEPLPARSSLHWEPLLRRSTSTGSLLALRLKTHISPYLSVCCRYIISPSQVLFEGFIKHYVNSHWLNSKKRNQTLKESAEIPEQWFNRCTGEWKRNLASKFLVWIMFISHNRQ